MMATITIMFFKPQIAHAQVQVNIGIQPLWGPVEYDYVEYYYLPEYEVYYYVPRRQFWYMEGGAWRYATALPPRFGSINYYSTYKVVVNEPRAYKNFHVHKTKYVGFKSGGPAQLVIRDSREPKYYVVKGHPNNQGGNKSMQPAKGGNKNISPAAPRNSPPPKTMRQAPTPREHQEMHRPSGGKEHGGGQKHGAGGHGKGGGKH